jgi:hypothetical protein
MTSSSTNRRNKSVLAVDDESTILDIIKHSLQKQEFKDVPLQIHSQLQHILI